MHTDPTLDILSRVTTSLGNSLQGFQEKTCTMFQTRELERERAARRRRQEKNTANGGARPAPATSSNAPTTANRIAGPTYPPSTEESTNAANDKPGPTPPTVSSARKPKYLNLNTYTYHALGDYAKTIQHFGTTDSYSTQPVSL
jgi:hypothetical protein